MILNSNQTAEFFENSILQFNSQTYSMNGWKTCMLKFTLIKIRIVKKKCTMSSEAMKDGHCLRPVLLLLVVIFTMLLNVIEQALNVQQEDVQGLADKLRGRTRARR